MRKYIAGVITGVVLTSSIAFAVSYIAEPANFKVLVNGRDFVSDPPALMVDGRTYLPLRAIGEALGVSVNWNEKLNQAEVGEKTTVKEEIPVADNQSTYTRSDPAPLNTAQTYSKTYTSVEKEVVSTFKDYTADVKVIQIIRGADALAKMEKENSFVQEPTEGYEYLLAKIAFSVTKVEDDAAFEVSDYNFKAFSTTNEEAPGSWNVGPAPQLDGKLFTGASTEGWVVVQVKIDDPTPKLAYGLDSNGQNGIWFALSE